MESPRDKSLTDTYTPTIRIRYGQVQRPDFGRQVNLDVGTLRIEIDGTDRTSYFTIDSRVAVWEVPPDMAFPPGRFEIHASISNTAGRTRDITTTFFTPAQEYEGSGFLDGAVYDSRTNEPLAEAEITVAERFEEGVGGVFTDGYGRYSCPTPGTGTFVVTARIQGYTYGQEVIECVSGLDAAVEPIYVIPVDPAVEVIPPEGGTYTNSDDTVRIDIPAGAVDEAIEVRATPFEEKRELPRDLPPTTHFTYCADLEPNGATFEEEVEVRVRNDLGFATGQVVPVGWYNEDTQTWITSDNGVVVDDGGESWIVFQVRHFSPWDCNFPVVPSVPSGGQAPGGDGTESPYDTPYQTRTGTQECGSRILVGSGILLTSHSVPSVRFMNRPYTVTLVYNSDTVNTNFVLGTKTYLAPGADLPLTSGFKVYVEGVFQDIWFEGTTGRTYQRLFFDGKNARGERLETGIYPYLLVNSNDYQCTYWATGYFGGPPLWDTHVPAPDHAELTTETFDYLAVHNLRDSPYGAGWWPRDLCRVYADTKVGGKVLLIDEESNKLVFSGRSLFSDLVTTNVLADSVSLLLGRDDGRFAGKRDFGVGEFPQDLVAADFDGDGNEDLAVVNTGFYPAGHTVSVLLSTGDGSFAAGVQYPVGNQPIGIAAADLDGDSVCDLAVANALDDTVSVLLGVGDGTFGAHTTYYAGNQPTDIVVADFNNDAHPDLAVTNPSIWTRGTVSVLLADQNGGFAAPVLYEVGYYPDGIATADLNRDGIFDLIVSNLAEGTVSVLPGKGDGSFVEETFYPVGLEPRGITTGDFNADGYLDIVVANSGSASVSLLQNTGDGRFNSAQDFAVGDQPVAVVATDFNGDGLDDIAVTNNGNDTVSVLLGRLDGTFEAKVDYGTGAGPWGLALGNFDRDAETLGDVCYISPPGDFSNLTHHGDATFTRRLKDGTVHRFDSRGYQTAIEDTNGNVTTYRYDASDHLSEIELPTGHVFHLNYSPDGYLESIDDPAGRRTQFVVGPTADGAADLNRIVNADATEIVYGYDQEHRLKSVSDENGNVKTYTYDSDGGVTDYGRMVTVTFPERDYATVDGSGGYTIARGSRQKLIEPGDIKGLTNELGLGGRDGDSPAPPVRDLDVMFRVADGGCCGSYSGLTNVFGDLLYWTDDLGRESSWERDADDLPTQMTRPNASVVTYAYDDEGNLTEEEEQTNHATYAYTYEPSFNKVAQITEPEGAITTFAYDAAGNLTRATDPYGTLTLMTYDSRGRVISITRAANVPQLQNVYNFTYYADYPQTGNLHTVTDPLGNATQYTYDESTGLTTSATDAEGHVTEYTYDDMNQLRVVIQRAASLGDPTTRYEYDGAGNLISMADAESHVTTFEYNEENMLSCVRNALGQETRYYYDLHGNLAVKQTGLGDIVFAYDTANRLVTKWVFGAGGETTTYSYDSMDNLTQAIDSDSSLTFGYDALSRMTSASTVGSPYQPGVILTYEYDLNDNRTKMRGPVGDFLYGYDAVHRRLTSITNPLGEVFGLEYDALDRRTQLAYPTGAEAIYTYLPTDWLESLTNRDGAETISSFAYEYDGVGNRTRMDEVRATFADGPNVYGYNELYWLVSATHPDPANPAESFSYDRAGNRTSGAGIYDSANQLIEDEFYRYSYDANGNMTERLSKASPGTRTEYAFNAENVMVRLELYPDDLPGTVPSRIVSFVHDGLSRRIGVRVNGDETYIERLVYDDEDILAVYDDFDVLVATYTYGGDTDDVLATAGAELYWHFRDGLGSTSETRAGSELGGDYLYSGFGNMVATTADGATRYGYTSREFAAESAYADQQPILYYRARYYDPWSGRFLSVDPLGVSAGPNLYLYVADNPLRYTDPYGLALCGWKKCLYCLLTVCSLVFGPIDDGDRTGPWLPNVEGPTAEEDCRRCLEECKKPCPGSSDDGGGKKKKKKKKEPKPRKKEPKQRPAGTCPAVPGVDPTLGPTTVPFSPLPTPYVPVPSPYIPAIPVNWNWY
ncbi:MAG: FG-GAP-like repeat-containing protein [Planctomycetota bacterium]